MSNHYKTLLCGNSKGKYCDKVYPGVAYSGSQKWFGRHETCWIEKTDVAKLHITVMK